MFRLNAAAPLLFALGSIVVLAEPFALHAQGFIAPTPEELTMTSIPEVPGADAVVLTRDELDDDDNHVRNVYYRIKVLTEAGVSKYGDVELEFDKRTDLGGQYIGELYARTVEPDGTIVPLTAKPQDKLLAKNKDNQFMARVFSFPAVKVGSILEYRYTIRWDDHHFFRPSWDIQTDLFLRKGHFLWRPTDKELIGTTRGGRESITERLAWTKSLPAGVDLKTVRLPTGRVTLELSVADVKPFLEEDHMPPIRSSRYHVFFYYTPYYTTKDFWTTEFKYWNSDTKKFENVSGTVRDQAQQAAAGAGSDEEKARTLYAYAMTLENTDYTRKRTSQEEKEEIKSAEDVVKRKHGSSDQIAMTYVALAHAAGLEAGAMIVANRANLIMDPTWLDFDQQLTDVIAVVKYGGSEHYLDPGSRYVPFGHLAWGHTFASGLLQDAPTDIATMIKRTPFDTYQYSHTSRVADVKVGPDGHMTANLTLTFDGNQALGWRHIALRNDEAELRERLKKTIQSWMPGGSEVEVKTVSGVDNGEVPLKVIASVEGQIGSSAGSRVTLPSALFESNSRPEFPHETRDQAVYFSYPEFDQDAVRYTLPASWSVESAPTDEKTTFQKTAAYSLKSTQTPNTITLRRDMVMGDFYFPLKDYPELRTFYNTVEHHDHGAVVLKRAPEKASLQ